MKSESILKAVTAVTKDWCKQRKAEEKNRSARSRRQYYSTRINFTEVANMILPEAYQHASGGGKYTVAQRQMYYAARDAFFAATGRHIEAQYFTQTILRQYLNRHNVDWKITADPRGTFIIPNGSSEKRVPVGTVQIDKHLEERALAVCHDVDLALQKQWPSLAEGQRYQAILYIEKEGFDPQLNEAKIAEKYDLAILSCKGQSVVAARKLVDKICAVQKNIPLFVLHDFDKYGFEILNCLTTVSEEAENLDRIAYHFENDINVTDLGLRLEDIQKYDLKAETCKKATGFWGLNITKEEAEFLASGRRVELNAFTAPQFIEWLESKLSKHLPNRLVPSDDVLEQAYRRAIAVNRLNEQLTEIAESARAEADAAKIPKSLARKVSAYTKKHGVPWDIAIHRIIES
jgi:DNA topoisomerase VI subunit A